MIKIFYKIYQSMLLRFLFNFDCHFYYFLCFFYWMFLLLFLHYNYGCLNRWILDLFLFKPFLFQKKLIYCSLLLFFKFSLFLFLTNIILKIIKLLFHCSLTFLILEYRLRYWFYWCITNRDKNWFFN